MAQMGNLWKVVFLFVGAIAQADRQILPLSEVRKSLVLPSYTAQDRTTLANQADFVIRNLFVHREVKIQDFGVGIDPLPKLATLRNEAKDISDAELHQRLSSIFTDLHDLHTNYVAPRPLACGIAFIPLRFESVLDGNERAIVVSRRLQTHSELTTDISVGDKVIAIQDRPVENYLKDLEAISSGANADAIRMRAVALLSMRSLRSQAMPTEDKLTLKFQGSAGTYSKEIPWLALFEEECVSPQDEEPTLRRENWFKLAEDDFQKRYNRIFGTPASPPKETFSWSDEENPLSEVFEVVSLSTPAGKIGYVQLKGFSWENSNLDVATVLEGFRRAVEGKLANSIGIVIDTRGNPGGYITLAEKLVQLFSHRAVEPSTVRMLANQINAEIFLRANGQNNRWTDAIKSAEQEGKKYTKPLAITSASDANGFGQVWFRPVIVLTDASCYSACDLFAAGMQDSGAGTIIGLHRSTGAGGANVMEYNVFRKIMAGSENPFEPLPFNQNMRVAWRQTIRTGKHKGELLENKGVISDYIVPLRLADIGSESKQLMKQVHKIIDDLLPTYTSGLGVRRGNSVLLKNNEPASWKETAYGVDTIDILVDSKRVAQIDVSFSSEPKEILLDVASLTGEWHDQPVVLEGKWKSKTVFRSVRELKWRGEYTSIPAQGIEIAFDDETLGVAHTVSIKGEKNSGWQIKDGALRIGKGPLYPSGVLARTILPLRLNGKGGKLEVELSLQAEDEHDSLRIYATNPDNGERQNIFSGSNIPRKAKATVSLPREWENADVVFEFESDENWNLKGPILDRLLITP